MSGTLFLLRRTRNQPFASYERRGVRDPKARVVPRMFPDFRCPPKLETQHSRRHVCTSPQFRYCVVMVRVDEEVYKPPLFSAFSPFRQHSTPPNFKLRNPVLVPAMSLVLSSRLAIQKQSTQYSYAKKLFPLINSSKSQARVAMPCVRHQTITKYGYVLHVFKSKKERPMENLSQSSRLKNLW
jgi:hypothetical protein